MQEQKIIERENIFRENIFGEIDLKQNEYERAKDDRSSYRDDRDQRESNNRESRCENKTHVKRSRSRDREKSNYFKDNQRNNNEENPNYNKKKNRRYKKKAKKRAQDRKIAIKKLLKGVSIKSYLDVGCGNASISIEVGKLYKVDRIYGVDVFPESDFKAVNCPSFSYHQVVGNKIPLPDESVDLVSCFVSIHHFEFFDEMAREMNRLLAPGGYLFIREHDCHPTNTTLVTYLHEMHKKFPKYIGKSYYWSKQDLRDALEKSGYEFIGEDTFTGPNPQNLYHSLFKKK